MAVLCMCYGHATLNKKKVFGTYFLMAYKLVVNEPTAQLAVSIIEAHRHRLIRVNPLGLDATNINYHIIKYIIFSVLCT